MVTWLVHVLGMDDPAGRWYGFWSGAGSDLGEAAIVGGLISILRKHNCHVHGCWRVGRHPVEGTSYLVCRRHHPDGKVTHQDILGAHQAAKRIAASLIDHHPERK